MHAYVSTAVTAHTLAAFCSSWVAQLSNDEMEATDISLIPPPSQQDTGCPIEPCTARGLDKCMRSS
eukprot:14084078-Alexandrium_andersonii.AAC.1